MSVAKVLNLSEIINAKFGKLTIISESEPYVKPNGKKDKMVNAICDCGVQKKYRLSHIKSGATKSCGCIVRESPNNFKHGLSSKKMASSEYKTWGKMKSRCLNPNDSSYKDYGGRGIKVSDNWINSFDLFLKDMGLKPSPNHSIERIDVNGNYCKENCCWANIHQQTANRRSNNKTVGVCFDNDRMMWIAHLQFNGVYVLRKRFNTELEAIDARKLAEKQYNIIY